MNPFDHFSGDHWRSLAGLIAMLYLGAALIFYTVTEAAADIRAWRKRRKDHKR